VNSTVHGVVHFKIRDKDGREMYWCDTIDILGHQGERLIRFVGLGRSGHICRFEADSDAITLGYQRIEHKRYQVYSRGLQWDAALISKRSLCRMWNVLLEWFWENIDISVGDPFLCKKWEAQEKMDFRLYDYQTAFKQQMYELCGRYEPAF